MPATITLQTETDDFSAFDEAIAELDRVEKEANDAGAALADVNRELESRSASDYAKAVKKAADELDGTADKARKAKEETEKLAAQNERMAKLSAGVTAVSSAFTALKDGGEIAIEVFNRTYEAISRLAERGNEGMMELKSSIDSFNFSADHMLEALLTADGQLTATGERINTRLQEISRGWDVYFEVILGVTREQRMATEARLNGEQALAEYKAKVAAEDDARFFAELKSLDDVNKRLTEQLRLLELQSEGKYTGTPERLKEIQNDLNMLTARRNELLREQEGAVERVAAAEQKAAEEAMKAEEERYQQAIANADEVLERTQKLYDMALDGMKQLEDEDRDRQQTLEEYYLKREGREDELHDKRMEWIKEETDAAVQAAETEEERITARLNGERRLRNELHNEKMRLLAEEERRQKEIEDAGKKAEADRLAQLQGAAGSGDKLNRGAAIQQVLQARQMSERRDFFAEGRDEGLSAKEVDRELAILQRQVMRRTQTDVRMNRLTESELARSQEQIAEQAGRQAESQMRSSESVLNSQQKQKEVNEEIISTQEEMARRQKGIVNMLNGDVRRAAAVRRGLG